VGAVTTKHLLMDSHDFKESERSIPFVSGESTGITLIDRIDNGHEIEGRVQVEIRMIEGAVKVYSVKDVDFQKDYMFAIDIAIAKMDTNYGYKYTTCPDSKNAVRHETNCVTGCSGCKTYAKDGEVGFCWSDVNRWFCEPLGCVSVNQGSICVACTTTPDKTDCTDVYEKESKAPRYTLCIRLQTGVVCRDLSETDAIDETDFSLFVDSHLGSSFIELPDRIAIRRKDHKISYGKICPYGAPSAGCFGSTQYDGRKGGMVLKHHIADFKGDWHCNGISAQRVETKQCRVDSYSLINSLEKISHNTYKTKSGISLVQEDVSLGVLKITITLNGIPKRTETKPSRLEFSLNECKGCMKCNLGMMCGYEIKTDVTGLYNIECPGFKLELNYILVKTTGSQKGIIHMGSDVDQGKITCNVESNGVTAKSYTSFKLEDEPKQIYQEKDATSDSVDETKGGCFIFCGFSLGWGSLMDKIIQAIILIAIIVMGLMVLSLVVRVSLKYLLSSKNKINMTSIAKGIRGYHAEVDTWKQN
jgi:hypothetical protein